MHSSVCTTGRQRERDEHEEKNDDAAKLRKKKRAQVSIDVRQTGGIGRNPPIPAR